MSTSNQPAEIGHSVAEASSSTRSVWVGRVLSGLVVLFLIPDGIIKFIKLAPVVETFAHLGLPLSLANGLAILLLFCTAVYAFPRSSVLGAILLTGYLGGAVATDLRAGDPLFSHVLFPTYWGVRGALAWVVLAGQPAARADSFAELTAPSRQATQTQQL